MKNKDFNQLWNDGYNFNNLESIGVIEAVEAYTLDSDTAEYFAGQKVGSPWGTNQVLEYSQDDSGQEICKKELTVLPGNMLSLQRHRGRAELWEVKSGILTVIADGKRHDITAGNDIELPKGCVHCMINVNDEPVTVIETQTGICREKDNIRLVDFSGRPTYPLTSEVEYESAKLYREIASTIVK